MSVTPIHEALPWLQSTIERLTLLNMRLEGEGPWFLKVGDDGSQPFSVELHPQARQCEVRDLYSITRYDDGTESHVTMWDEGEWSTSSVDTSYSDWVAGVVEKLVGKTMNWTLGKLLEDYAAASHLIEFAAVSSQCLEVYPGLSALEPETAELANLGATMMASIGGDAQALERLCAEASECSGGLDDAASTFAVVVAAAPACLNDSARMTLIDALWPRVEAEVRRIGEAQGSDPRGFHELKTVIDRAVPELGARVTDLLHAMMKDAPVANEDERVLRAKIVRYNELYEMFRWYRPSCANPHEQGDELLSLEAEINQSWLASLSSTSGLARSSVEDRLVRDGRFLSGGSMGYLGWRRDRQEYDEVVELFCAQVADTVMMKLRHASQTRTFESLVNNALGAFLDSGDEEHIKRAIACVDAMEAAFKWETSEALYQLACVFARAGQVNRAVAMAKRVVEEDAASIFHILADSDMASIAHHPELLALQEP